MDFLSGISKALGDAWASVEGGLVGTPQLAGIGLVLLIGATFAQQAYFRRRISYDLV